VNSSCISPPSSSSMVVPYPRPPSPMGSRRDNRPRPESLRWRCNQDWGHRASLPAIAGRQQRPECVRLVRVGTKTA
jgi:hypothetical protein